MLQQKINKRAQIKKEQAQTQSWVKFVNIPDYFKVSLPNQSILKLHFFLLQKRTEYNFPCAH